jgi:hypothetical protein
MLNLGATPADGKETSAGGCRVALQGTIDTFPPRDVLDLLAAGGRSGRLVVQGDRGRAVLWLDGGSVTAAELSIEGMDPDPAAPVDRAVLEVLRFVDGEFTFDTGGDDGVPSGASMDLRDAMASAAARLAGWGAVSAALPDPAAPLYVATSISGPVTVESEQWAVLVAVTRMPGHTIRSLRSHLAADEMEWGGSLVGLLDAGLVEAGSAPTATADPAPVDHPVADLVPCDPASQPRGDAAAGSVPERFPIDDLLDGGDPWAPAPPVGDGVETFGWDGAFSDGAFSGGALAAFDDSPLGAFHDVVVEPADVPPDGDPPATWAADLDATDAPASPAPFSSLGPAGPEPWVDAAPASTWHPGTWDSAPDLTPSLVEGAASSSGGDPVVGAEPGSTGVDKMLRQMSRLSPKAADAIAAALGSPPPEDDPSAEPFRADDRFGA